MRRLLLIVSILLFLAGPVMAQGPIYLPLVSKDSLMPAPKSTLGIVSPIEDKNHVLNPSAEGTTSYAALGGATISRDPGFQKYGLFSYDITTNGAGTGLELDLETLLSAPYYVTARVRLSATPPGGIQFTLGVTKEARIVERIDSTWSLYGASFNASESAGISILEITQIGAGTKAFNVDGVQVSPVIEGRYYSTYIDGGQEGCRWLGAPHASASLRSGQSRAGGIVRDFYRDYGFVVEKMIGAGSVTEELAIDSYALLPGGELNNSKIQPREFSLVGYFLAATEEALHENVQRLELEMGLDTYPSRQPFRLRFSGAKVLKEIKARYAGGLEGELPVYYDDCLSIEDEKWVNNRFFKARAAIQLVAEDPFWYEVGESATLLDTLSSDTFRVVAGRLMDGGWSSLGPPGAGGTYSNVRVIVEDDVYIYIGGTFENWDNIANADKIVRYNKQTGIYSALGTGMAGAVTSVNAIAIAPDGSLYVGGDFTSAGGVANTLRIAKWDGTQWLSLGTGANGTVFALAIGPTGLLYAAGSFTTMNGVAVDRVTYYDGATWNAMSTGLSGAAFALAIDPSGLVYIGHAGTEFINTWDGSSFGSLAGGMDNAVRALAIAPNGVVYAGGQFTTAGGISASHIAAWNGVTWAPLGVGANNTVYSLAVGIDGVLYLSGEFTEAGGITLADRLARWNGYTYSHMDIDLPGSAQAFAIYPSSIGVDTVVPSNYEIYLGFNTTGTGSFSGDETVNNAGSISAFPQIIFNRTGGTSATIQSIKNERTGKGILFDYPLLDGETLTLDLNPKKRTIVSSFFGPVWRATLPGGQLSTWQLLPGDNQISAFVSESGSPSVMAYVAWRSAFRSYH